MCFATAALVAGAVGAGTSAIGTIEGGQATANAASYNAQVAKNNAVVATQNAQFTMASGQERAQAESLKNAQTAGKIKASQAASGIDVNSGSAVNVQQSQREEGELDTQTTLSNAALTAYGYRTQAVNDTAQAGLETEEAEQAPIGADIGAAGGLLSSASSLGLKWSQPTPTQTTDGGGYTGFSQSG